MTLQQLKLNVTLGTRSDWFCIVPTHQQAQTQDCYGPLFPWQSEVLAILAWHGVIYDDGQDEQESYA